MKLFACAFPSWNSTCSLSVLNPTGWPSALSIKGWSMSSFPSPQAMPRSGNSTVKLLITAVLAAGSRFMARWRRPRPARSASATSAYWLMGGGYSTSRLKLKLANARASSWGCICGWPGWVMWLMSFAPLMSFLRWWRDRSDRTSGRQGADRGEVENLRGTQHIDAVSCQDLGSIVGASLAAAATAHRPARGWVDVGVHENHAGHSGLQGGQLR